MPCPLSIDQAEDPGGGVPRVPPSTDRDAPRTAPFKSLYRCPRCAVHGSRTAGLGPHHVVCPHRHCTCEDCTSPSTARRAAAGQDAAQDVAPDPCAAPRSTAAPSGAPPSGPAPGEAGEAGAAEDRQDRQRRWCRRCKQHGTLSSPNRGHYLVCDYRACTCRGCQLIARQAICTQNWHRRRALGAERTRASGGRGRGYRKQGCTRPATLASDLVLVPVVTLGDDGEGPSTTMVSGVSCATEYIVTRPAAAAPSSRQTYKCRKCHAHGVEARHAMSAPSSACPYVSCYCNVICRPLRDARRRVQKTKQRWLQATTSRASAARRPVVSAEATASTSTQQQRAAASDPMIGVSTGASDGLSGRPASGAAAAAVAAPARWRPSVVLCGEAPVEAETGERVEPQPRRPSVLVMAGGRVAAPSQATVTASDTHWDPQPRVAAPSPIPSVSVKPEQDSDDEDDVVVLGVRPECPACGLDLATEAELQDHVDEVHLQVLPLSRAKQLARMLCEAWATYTSATRADAADLLADAMPGALSVRDD